MTDMIVGKIESNFKPDTGMMEQRVVTPASTLRQQLAVAITNGLLSQGMGDLGDKEEMKNFCRLPWMLADMIMREENS